MYNELLGCFPQKASAGFQNSSKLPLMCMRPGWRTPICANHYPPRPPLF